MQDPGNIKLGIRKRMIIGTISGFLFGLFACNLMGPGLFGLGGATIGLLLGLFENAQGKNGASKFAHFCGIILIVLMIPIGFLFLTGLSIVPRCFSPCTGDGKLHETSIPMIGFLGAPRYDVEFPEFDLSNPHEATYQVGNLPALRSRSGCQIYLAFRHQSWDIWEKMPHEGGFEIQILDTKGNLISGMESDFKKSIFSSSGNVIKIYNLKNSYPKFYPAKGKDYQMTIKYRPSPAFKELKGYVFFECGGI